MLYLCRYQKTVTLEFTLGAVEINEDVLGTWVRSVT